MSKSEIRRLFEVLFSHASEGIILCLKDGTIHSANPVACHQFGYEEGELNNEKIEVLIPKKSRESHIEYRHEYNEESSHRRMGHDRETLGLTKQGKEFPVEVSLSPAVIDGKEIIVVFTLDVSKSKNQEQLIQRKQKELEALTQRLMQTNEQLEKKVADRTKVLHEALTALENSKEELQKSLVKERELNELKSRFLSMASHEFRTPLTAILSSAGLIGEYKEETHQEKRLKHVERITNAVISLNDILTDFLSYSKFEEGKIAVDFKSFHLTDLLDEVKAEVKALLQKNQRIITRYKGESEIISDRKLIRQILINLLSNAIKYSYENSEIRLITNVTSRLLNFEIHDKGIGISQEDQKHLFERFFRGSNAGSIQGTGLGLNIVNGYVELLNGEITFESKLKKGTSFFITIPLKKQNY
ncbi:MAG: PAS domain-containing sensor histidine kinase [Bacteroidia bacterium]|nr:PAS domain S-box protein [Bacteroidia bacterium]MCZ2276702.1 PAS domain-containing sensor histidine kinase [Bacteroidia bacterium]